MAKRALLVGIDYYESMPDLSCSVRDATALRDMLQRHADGSPNYDCKLLVNPGGPLITRELLQTAWRQLFTGFTGDLLFYFAGHGWPTQAGGALVTHEGDERHPGLPMQDLLDLANASSAREVLLILDCCHAGALGNVGPRGKGKQRLELQTALREGVTILAASRAEEEARAARGEHGVFTDLLLAALAGGAADVRGNISAAAIYAFTEQALGAWDQRPLYKSNASSLAPVRRCEPLVSDTLLRQIPHYFATEDACYRLDPSYEFTQPEAQAEHVMIFKDFKRYRDAGLLRTVEDEDLYFAALHSSTVTLTALGRFYWRLATHGRI